MTTDTTAGLFGEMCFRTSSTNALTNNTVLRMSTDGLKLQKVVAGVVTVLDSEASATATANTWYRVRILAKGSNVTVWRGEGDDGPMEEVLSSSAVPTLTTVSMWFISGANAAFAYDDVAIVANGWTSDTTFATNSGNELTSSTFGGVTTTYGYDAWGQMTSKARGSYTASYGWHYGGELTGVTSDFPGEGTVTFAYGGDGKRRERNEGTVTRYRWDGSGNLLHEENGSGTLAITYVGTLADVVGANPASGLWRFYSHDVLGSVRQLWDDGKTSLSENEFEAYGTPYLCISTTSNLGFTSKPYDSTAATQHYPYRVYMPALSRWGSRDSIASSTHLYAYVGCNPVGYFDPDGRFQGPIPQLPQDGVKPPPSPPGTPGGRVPWVDVEALRIVIDILERSSAFMFALWLSGLLYSEETVLDEGTNTHGRCSDAEGKKLIADYHAACDDRSGLRCHRGLELLELDKHMRKIADCIYKRVIYQFQCWGETEGPTTGREGSKKHWKTIEQYGRAFERCEELIGKWISYGSSQL